jgi:hypothetical protein
MKSRNREEESPGPNQTFQPQRGSEIPFGCRRDLKLKLWSPVNLRIDNPHGSWFCKAVGAARARIRLMPRSWLKTTTKTRRPLKNGTTG